MQLFCWWHLSENSVSSIFIFSFQDPKIVLENGNGIIVPIVIGALITTIILIVVIFFFVRRKNNSNKYNCDTNADNAAESEKLNEEA